MLFFYLWQRDLKRLAGDFGMVKMITLQLIVVFFLVFLCAVSSMSAQNSAGQRSVDLEDAYVDDVDFFDDKVDDLFDDFDRILAEDLDALFEQIVVEEDYQEKKMTPRLIDEEVLESDLFDLTDETEPDNADHVFDR
jgi:hypothetical protein